MWICEKCCVKHSVLMSRVQSITAKQIGMLNWGSHTEGAIQLVKARGKKQLKSKTGLALFIAVRTQMVCGSFLLAILASYLLT